MLHRTARHTALIRRLLLPALTITAALVAGCCNDRPRNTSVRIGSGNGEIVAVDTGGGDDVSVRIGGSDPRFASPENVVAPNLMKNASFEHTFENNRTRPVFYGNWLSSKPTEGPGAHTGSGVDDTVALHGKQSFRMKYRPQKSKRQPLVILFTSSYRVIPQETYTFSLFARSGGGIDALRLQYEIFTRDGKGFFKKGSGNLSIAETAATGEFKRLHVTFKAPAGGELVRFFIHYWQPGTAWVDAAKLERGGEPTPWVPGPTMAELGGPQCEKLFVYAAKNPPGGDDNIAAIGSIDPNTIDDDLYSLADAIDGNPKTYWASNAPSKQVPKDMVLTLRKPKTVRGATLSYYNEGQAPHPDGGLKILVRDKQDAAWSEVDYTVTRREAADPEPAVQWTLAFDAPVDIKQVRFLFVKMKDIEGRNTDRPAVREVELEYAE